MRPSQIQSRHPQYTAVQRKSSATFWVAIILLIAAVFAATIAGTFRISAGEILTVIRAHLFNGDPASVTKVQNTIIWEIRFPRILLCILIGAALSVSGAAYQSAFRNPLVEPFILGVSSGATLGASLAILYPTVIPNIQIGAFGFAVLAVSLVLLFAKTEGKTPIVNLILGGVIISSVFTAGVSLLKYISDDAALRAITFWSMGGLYYASWADIRMLTPYIVICIALLQTLAWQMNILSLGDDEAQSLGLRPEWLKIALIGIATLMTALVVSTVGIISWIGLMMPHAARMLVGSDNRKVIPAAAIFGAIYLLICDTLARTLTGAEIPVSILTSIIGAPYLFYLLKTRSRYASAG